MERKNGKGMKRKEGKRKKEQEKLGKELSV